MGYFFSRHCHHQRRSRAPSRWKASAEFTRPIPSLIVLVGYGIAFGLPVPDRCATFRSASPMRSGPAAASSWWLWLPMPCSGRSRRAGHGRHRPHHSRRSGGQRVLGQRVRSRRRAGQPSPQSLHPPVRAPFLARGVPRAISRGSGAPSRTGAYTKPAAGEWPAAGWVLDPWAPYRARRMAGSHNQVWAHARAAMAGRGCRGVEAVGRPRGPVAGDGADQHGQGHGGCQTARVGAAHDGCSNGCCDRQHGPLAGRGAVPRGTGRWRSQSSGGCVRRSLHCTGGRQANRRIGACLAFDTMGRSCASRSAHHLDRWHNLGWLPPASSSVWCRPPQAGQSGKRLRPHRSP